MYGPTEATNTETALLQPRRSLQNVGAKDKDDDDRRTREHGNDQFQAFGADGFTFLDFLDIINPLQHIPIVGSLYRDMTGDEIDPASRVIGGSLFGGPVGTIAALVNVSLEGSTGKDMGDHVLTFFDGEDGPDGDGAPVLANAPATGGQLADASQISQITANIEVLDWAKREAAFSGRAVGAEEQAWADPDATAASAGGVSDATEHSLRVAKRSGDIAAHTEVLDWARREGAVVRAAVEKAEAMRNEAKGDIRRTQEDIRQVARNRATRSIARHDQLTGATAPGGGWFSDTMLTAVATYEQSALLGKVDDPRQGLKAANVTN